MAQSLAKILIHIVVSTKNHHPFLDSAIRPELYAYLAGIFKANGSHAIKIGGVENHIHIFCTLPKSISLADLIEEFKKSSSKWVKTKGPQYELFYWQNGYGAFSIGQSDADRLIKYIETQEEHHRTKTFKEELRAFLEKYKIPYDERYIWD
jgi:putative transposase